MADENQRDVLAMQGKTDHERHYHGDDDAMSPVIRQLIFSFGATDSKQTWDPDAFSEPPLQPSKRAAV